MLCAHSLHIPPLPVPLGTDNNGFPVLAHSLSLGRLTGTFVAGWRYTTTTSAVSSSHATCSQNSANRMFLGCVKSQSSRSGL